MGGDADRKISNHSEQESSCAQTELRVQEKQLAKAKAVKKRIHRRFAYAVRVSVDLPFLPTMDFGARNL
jgi:hypothetical protein